MMDDDKYNNLLLVSLSQEKGANNAVSWICTTLLLVVYYTEKMPSALRWMLGLMMGAMAVKAVYYSVKAARVLGRAEKEEK